MMMIAVMNMEDLKEEEHSKWLEWNIW